MSDASQLLTAAGSGTINNANTTANGPVGTIAYLIMGANLLLTIFGIVMLFVHMRRK